MKTIYLIGEVEYAWAGPVVRALDALTEADECAVLKITSGGGDVGCAQAIIASMQTAAVPVYTFAVGEVCSAAVDILANGAKRGIHPATLVMTHSSDAVVTGKVYAQLETERDRHMYARRPKVLENWHTLFSKRKRYWTAQDMVRFDLADYVAERPLTDYSV